MCERGLKVSLKEVQVDYETMKVLESEYLYIVKDIMFIIA